jgi:hypothetical protein
MTKTPGQIAYELDVEQQPSYGNKRPRSSWGDLSEVARASWERNPTPRYGGELKHDGALRWAPMER